VGEKRNAFRILVVNPEGKIPPGRTRPMDLREIGWDCMG
jgi:hypothetical protein